jgi:signal transduction histidine kinase/ligand-binding sensor domain-containing protein/DNA-binding response OmpR family regulator
MPLYFRTRIIRILFNIGLSVAILKPVFSQPLFFSTLSIKDGLPSNIISGITQDQHDFIWIGTGHGLTRYDGYHFRTFQKNESIQSIPSNETSCLLADGEFVWVGTWNGLCKIHTTTFEVTRIDLGSNKAVRTLNKGIDDIIWIGTETGLIEYKTTQGIITNIFNSSQNGLSHNTIRSVYQDKNGTLWVGTYDKLNKLKPGSTKFEVFDLKGKHRSSIKNNLVCGEIKPVSSTSDSLLWVGTETGLCLFNTFTGSYKRFGDQETKFSNEVIKCIYPDNDGNLWLGTDFGLNIFSPTSQTNQAYFHNPQTPYSIANNAIWQIFEDTGGVIWFVTSNGLSRLNKNRNFYKYHEVLSQIDNQLVGNQVKAVLTTKDGVVWLATLHGVIRIDQNYESEIFSINTPEPKKILLNNSYALEEDNLGRIWIGTAGGINIWDEGKRKMYAITTNATNGLITNYIAKFIRGSDGSFWVSTYQGGLFKVIGNFSEVNSLQFKLVTSDFGSEKVVSGKGALWFSVYNELFRVDERTLAVKRIDNFNSLRNKWDIHSLYFSERGILWAGTQNGLVEYDPELNTINFRPINTGRDVNIGNIAEDHERNIWAATNYSIYKYNITTHETEIYPLDKDLPLKGFFYGCSAKSQAGEIIFGGDNGYISFESNKLKPNHYQPKVYITALEINNKDVVNDEELDGKVLLENDIAFTPELTLDYAHRSITFEFATLHYWQPGLNVYAYKLDGFDTDWKYVSGQKNFAVYSNLSPKKYTFRVKGTNNYGVWSEAEAVATIEVRPPLFLSWHFIGLYIIIIIILIFFALRMYSVRLHLKNEMKIIRLENEHMEELTRTKQQFFTNISHELRTPVSLILPPIHQILKHGKLEEENLKLITLAEKNSQRLLRVINQILDFRKLENDTLQVKVTATELITFCQDIHALFTDKANRKKIAFSFIAPSSELKIWMDTEKIETVLFNLLSNAFKFTGKGGEITFAIHALTKTSEYPEGIAEIKISDTGIGVSPEELTKIFEPFYQTREAKQVESGTGIGLALAAEYVKLHHGEIKVESTKGKGSTFTVLLPLGNSHFPIDFIHENQEINLVATKEIGPHEDAARKPYRFDLQSDKPLILIIDDSTDMVDFVRLSLSDKYNFISAENGDEGFQKANSFLPEIIISDIMMPVMDGLTLCKKIKSNSRTSHIAIILITAKGLTSQKIEGIRTGADVYITKPFEMEFLEANIDHLIARKKELAYYLKNELITQPIDNTSGRENEDDKFIKKVMNIIEANISNPDFSVDTLGAEIGMSTSQLYRKLKSLTKTSANDIIKKYRIKKASILLKNKEGNVSEIMLDVGFTNLSYFSKCFRTEFGLSPKEYQQKMSSGPADSIDIESRIEF